MKSLITALIPLLSFSFAFVACSLRPASAPAPSSSSPSPEITPQISSSGSVTDSNPVVAINTRHGQIVLRLYQSQCPKTVANFLKKIQSGFYRNLTFHRVEPGFVVQGGDPLGNGTGGGKIISEINQTPFRRGSLGLARGPIKVESNDSQFFICLADASCAPLTGEYVNFGEVISGMELVDKIVVGDKITDVIDKTK